MVLEGYFPIVWGLFSGKTFSWVLKRYHLGLSTEVLLHSEKVFSELTRSVPLGLGVSQTRVVTIYNGSVIIVIYVGRPMTS